MSTNETPFEDADTDAARWVDVRMTDPDTGEWDVDLVVADGRVEYVDLRVKPALLSAFVECLIDDVDDDRARDVIADVLDRRGIDIPSDPENE